MNFYLTKVGMLWSVLYFIFIFLWQIPAKKKYNIVGGNVSHSSGIETGRDFPPVFFVWLGRDGIFFCGSGTGEIWKSTYYNSNMISHHILYCNIK